MTEEVFEAIFIFLLILINGVLSMSEIALVSARKSRLQQLTEEGSLSARAALELSTTPNRLLSTAQIGITLVGILSGAMGGQALSTRLNELLLEYLPFLAPYTYVISLSMVVGLISYFALVAGELIPKRLALLHTERVVLFSARPMLFLSKLAGPLVNVLSFSTDWGLRLLGVTSRETQKVSDEEIKVLLQEGTDEGIFEESEQDMVESIFRLSDRLVSAIMTPRMEIVFIDLDAPLSESLDKICKFGYARFPAAHGDLDHVQGIVLLRDVLPEYLGNKNIELARLVKPALFLPENMPALNALEQIKNTQTHAALVIDEYGGLLGMVTLDDVFRSIVGALSASGNNTQPSIIQRSDGSWLLDGMLDIDDLKEFLKLDLLPEEERVGYQTLGGFIMSQLGVIPTVGQCFEYCNFRFEVLDMDGRRVDKVLVVALT